MKRLTSIGDFDEALARSEREAVFIYKHSTACGLSAVAHDRVTAYVGLKVEGSAPVYIVNLLETRSVSNEIADRLGVEHQSPQLILVKDRRAVWHASHGAINEEAIVQALATVVGAVASST
ncbi:MAG: bacillithiol system redox-active protein YtxJ [Candidatus Krumholzibacteria bacterium]